MKILHLITSLEIGGANMMLYKLLCRTSRDRFEPVVVVLEDKGKLGPAIESLGIPVYPLNMQKRLFHPHSAVKLRNSISKIQPALIQAWTYHSNIAASIMGIFTPKIPVVWNIRHTPYQLSNYRKMTYLIIRYGG